jgi:hypothetical protein
MRLVDETEIAEKGTNTDWFMPIRAGVGESASRMNKVGERQ